MSINQKSYEIGDSRLLGLLTYNNYVVIDTEMMSKLF